MSKKLDSLKSKKEDEDYADWESEEQYIEEGKSNVGGNSEMDLLPKGMKWGDSKNGYLNKLMGGDPDRDTDREDEPTT